jgi:hypothetical protein
MFFFINPHSQGQNKGTVAKTYGLQVFFPHALIKKKTKFSSYIRKFRWDRVQIHILGRGSYEEMLEYFHLI